MWKGFGKMDLTRLATIKARTRSRVAGFRGDESGSLIIFSLFLFVLIMMAGGMAVDLMRYESTRTNVQNTLDRAILAAADLDQETEASLVIDDYFEKAGIGLYDPSTTSVKDGTSSWVQSSATAHVQTFFMKNLGIDMLPAVAQSTAEERVSDIEISLVLDISGSMDDSGRIGNMKTAAKNFIDTIYADAEPDTVTVSIIPYNTQVNVGPDILKNYNRTHSHELSHCIDFDASDFNTTAISTSSTLKQTGHFDSLYVYGSPYYRSHPEFLTCQTDSSKRVLPFQDDTTALKNYIQNLDAGGNTSIDVGLKWGVAMLDPSFEPVVESLVSDGVVDAQYGDRPKPYTGSESSLKVVVVMTDGHNTAQFYMPDQYSSGPSLFYRDPSNNRLSIWRDRNGCTMSANNTANYNNCWYRVSSGYTSSTPDGGSDAVNLDYITLWDDYKTNYIANKLYYAGVYGWGYNTWDNQFYKYVDENTKDSRMAQICTQAKNREIVVFSIGFEVSDSDATVMYNCATSESHFFRVAGSQLTTAFSEIANKISQLRLVD